MPKKITKYKCDYCRRSYARIKACEAHENLCFYNPDRVPKQGELAIWETLPTNLKQISSYGVPNSDWDEPLEKYFDVTKKLTTTFNWWPKDEDGEIRLGLVYIDGKWEEIDGYKPPDFSPGLCWRDEIIPDAFMEKLYDIEFNNTKEGKR